MNMRDVVISGLGLVSPHGDDPAVVFDALLKGHSAIALWNRDGTAPAAVASVDSAARKKAWSSAVNGGGSRCCSCG